MTVITDSLLAALNNSSHFGCIIYEKDGKIIQANKGIANMLGYNEKELIGRSFVYFVTNPENDINYIIERRLAGEEFIRENVNYIFKSRNNSLIPVSASTYTVFYENKPYGLMLAIDKSKEKSYERIFLSLSQINELIVRVTDEETLLRKICDIFVDTVGYEATIVGYIDDSKFFRQKYVKAKNKDHEELLRALIIGVDPDTPYGKGSVARAFASHKIYLVSHVMEDLAMSYWHDYFRSFNINSSCSIPIIKNNKVEYIFLLFDSMQNSFIENKTDEVVKMAASCAAEVVSVVNDAVKNGEISSSDIWDRDYIPLPDTNPQKYKTKFTDFVKKHIQPIEDKYLRIDPNLRFFVLTDDNGYVAAHNSINDLPLTGDYKKDLTGNRSMRIFDDPVGLSVARNTDGFIVQTYPRDNGELMMDIGVPVFIDGRHWGAIRVGVGEDRMKLLEEIQLNVSYALEKIEIQREALILQEKLRIAAFFDALTGLPNRRALSDELEKAIARATRHKWQMAVAMIDLDCFKPVNDTYGHEAGDSVLQVIGKRLRNSLRNTDYVARLGGDEFVLIFEDYGNIDNLKLIFEKIEENIRIPVALSNENAVSVGLSMGVYLCDSNNDITSDAMLRYADNALYNSKEHKTDRTRYWTMAEKRL
ncbi:MAG: diguanylate cyclase [Deltaproteobacteria bacterium]|nr:diguanylate cyclase [Deltaproteobacteria bacterium]